MAADETVEEEGGGKGKGGSKLLLILLLVNTLGLGGLAAYVMLGMGGQGVAEASPEEAAAEAIEEPPMEDMPPPAAAGESGPMHEMSNLVINLNEPSGDRYLKAKIHLEVDTEETIAEVTARTSQIRYQLNVLLSGQRVVDVQGPENMEALRKAMLRRINATLSKGRVTGVWMVEWIVQ